MAFQLNEELAKITAPAFQPSEELETITAPASTVLKGRLKGAHAHQQSSLDIY